MELQTLPTETPIAKSERLDLAVYEWSTGYEIWLKIAERNGQPVGLSHWMSDGVDMFSNDTDDGIEFVSPGTPEFNERMQTSFGQEDIEAYFPEVYDIWNKRDELLDGYTIKDGVIVNPGKFENEPALALWFYDAYLNGGETYFEIDDEDIVAFPELTAHTTVYLGEDDQGFAYILYDNDAGQAASANGALDEDESEDDWWDTSDLGVTGA